MKKKTIQKIIGKKFDDFVASIDDTSVRDLVKKNTLISGGCIASMLMKAPVNDYDLYFTNKATTLAVARYYVAKFGDDPNMIVIDGDNANVNYVNVGMMHPGQVKLFIKSAGNISDPTYEHEDSEGDDADVKSVLGKDKTKTGDDDTTKPPYRPVYLSANAITLSDKIQIIIRFYGTPEEVHTNYDYVHCTNYWLSMDRKLHLNQPALEAILAKELVYVGSKYPIASILRTRKFIGRGWQIHAGNYLKMCYQVSKLNLDDLNVLEDQLTGVDAAYFMMLIDALQEAKKNNPDLVVDYGYLAEMIDKIFG